MVVSIVSINRDIQVEVEVWKIEKDNKNFLQSYKI